MLTILLYPYFLLSYFVIFYDMTSLNVIGITYLDDLMLTDHSIVLWVGDLNYRINDLTREDIIELIGKEDYSKLRTHDQLNIERLHNPLVFPHYHESIVTFAPSYKFDPGTDMYDSKKGRSPAWCDRILWRHINHHKEDHRASIRTGQLKLNGIRPILDITDTDTETEIETEIKNKSGSEIESSDMTSIDSKSSSKHQYIHHHKSKSKSKSNIICHKYEICDTIKCSDHRPIRALFTVMVDDINEKNEKKVREECLYNISKWENSHIPRVEMLSRHLIFSDCRVGQTSSQFIKIKNIGNTMAKWSFVSVTPGNPAVPDWITVVPSYDILMESEAREISINVHIPDEDVETAVALNEERIESILVVRVKGGSDFFIVVEVPVLGTLSDSLVELREKTIDGKNDGVETRPVVVEGSLHIVNHLTTEIKTGVETKVNSELINS
jgi:hypothetical protein